MNKNQRSRSTDSVASITSAVWCDDDKTRSVMPHVAFTPSAHGGHPMCTWGTPSGRWGKCCEHDLFPMWQHTPCGPHFRIAPSAYFFLFMMFSSGKMGCFCSHPIYLPHMGEESADARDV